MVSASNADAARANSWHRPLRAVHTVLREPDAADYDLDGILAWLRRWRANVYVVNGGGLSAFYQTNLPDHEKNPHLGGRDLFKEIVDACHAEGIKVVARMDFRGGRRSLFEAHPDWFSSDEAGAPKTTGNVSTAVLYTACPNSPFRNEGYAFPIVREIFEHCRPDGIWENACSFGGRCFCPTCRRLFREATGHDIPRAESWDDPVWRQYVAWRYDCVLEHTRQLRDVVKAYGPDMSYGGEFFTFLEERARDHTQDLDQIRDLWDYQMACIFPLTRGSFRSPLLPIPVWRAEEQMKYLRATGGGNGRGGEAFVEDAPASETSGIPASAQSPVMLYGHFDNQSRYTTPAREELRLWLAGMAAQGGSPWDCTFIGVPPERWWDRRHNDAVQQFLGFMADHEADFDGLRSVADVALVHSQRTQDRFCSAEPAHDRYITHLRGWELALFASHTQWDVLPPSQLTPDVLSRYRAVILPNVACLSDDEAEALRAYVSNGGVLIGTFETGCYHADGAPRSGGALDDLFGVQDLGVRPRGPLSYAYTRLRQPERGVLLRGFDGTEILTNEGEVRAIAAQDTAQVHATLVPEVFPQPPDLSYPRLWDADIPLLVTHSVGSGRTIYFAGQTDRLNVTSGHPDHQQLLENAIAAALDGRPPLIETDAPPYLHVTLLGQPATESLYVHLVNYSGARARPVAPPIPTGPVTIRLRVPGLPSAELSATQFFSKLAVTIVRTDDAVTLTVPTIDLYEVVRLQAPPVPR